MNSFFHLLKQITALGLAIMAILLAAGCAKQSVNSALESDANGFACLSCKAKFYTERKVFPTFCPECKQKDIESVVGLVCPDDKHVTIMLRGRGAAACGQCGKRVEGMCIPGEKDLKAWGAVKKTAAETGG